MSNKSDFLSAAHSGDLRTIRSMLRTAGQQGVQALLESTEEANGYSPLHMAALGGHTEIIRELIRRGSKVNQVDNNMETPLHVCAETGHVPGAELLLAGGAYSSAITLDGNTPIHYAAWQGKAEVLTLLLNHKYSPMIDSLDRNDNSALHKAAWRGFGPCVSILIKAGASLDLQDGEGDTPAHKAAWKGEPNVLKRLIEAGALLNLCDDQGHTPLHEAAWNGHLECCRLLVEANVDVDSRTHRGYPPLHNAAWRGHSHIVSFLIESGADVNSCDTHSADALQKACYCGHSKTVKVLVQAGCELNSQNDEGATALHKAVCMGNIACSNTLLAEARKMGRTVNVSIADFRGESSLHWAALTNQPQAISLLGKYGCDVEAKDREGATALHKACFRGFVECVRALARLGANLRCLDHELSEPIHKASWGGHIATVRLLFSLAASRAKRSSSSEILQIKSQLATVVDQGGDTPLHKAAWNGHAEIVGLLLENGAVPDAKEEAGRTPALVATTKGHLECLRRLVEAGADVSLADEEGDAPLARAASRGDVEAVRLVLDAGAAIDQKFNNERTALHQAVWGGQEVIVNVLIQASVVKGLSMLDWEDRWGDTVVHDACCRGATETLKQLISAGASFNRKNSRSCEPMHIAAFNGYVDCVKILLQAGVSPLTHDAEGDTPLHKAAFQAHLNVAECLLDWSGGSILNVFDKQGHTPLHEASWAGDVACVNLFIRHGSRVNVSDCDGTTPLHSAAVRGHADIIQILLSNGASVHAKDHKGVTPLSKVLQHHPTLAAMFLDWGASPRVVDNCGRCPLHTASWYGKASAIPLLLNAGVDPNARDNENATPLLKAAFRGSTSVVHELIKGGASLDAMDKEGAQAHHKAAWNGHVDVLKVLLSSKKLDVNQVDGSGDTPLAKAVFRNKPEVVRLLIAHGADPMQSLQIAVNNGYTEVVKVLLNSIPKHALKTATQAICDKGLNLLSHACVYGRSDLVAVLVGFGADPMHQDLMGFTPLHRCAARGHTTCISALLLSKPGSPHIPSQPLSLQLNPLALLVGEIFEPMEWMANIFPEVTQLWSAAEKPAWVSKLIQQKTPAGLTALDLAATLASGADCVSLLLSAGDDGQDIRSSMIRAASVGNVESLRLMLKYVSGCPWCSDTTRLETPMHRLILGGFDIQWLLSTGACLTHVMAHGCTPLHLAAQSSHVAVGQLLSAANARGGHRAVSSFLMLRDDYQRTALHYASHAKNELSLIRLIECLDDNDDRKRRGEPTWSRRLRSRVSLDGDAFPKTEEKLTTEDPSLNSLFDAHGFTPVHEACAVGWMDGIRILAKHGASLHSAGDDGLTPMMVAAACDQDGVVVRGLIEMGVEELEESVVRALIERKDEIQSDWAECV